jgi:uncharacterized protein (DUF1330 family)
LRAKNQEANDNQQQGSIHMSACAIVEFTVKDPDVRREEYAGTAGKTAQEHGAEVLANGNWEILDGETGLSSGVIVQFPDHETALRWLNISS